MQNGADNDQSFAWTAATGENQTVFLDREYLRRRTNWIRDDLDPLVAQEGPDVLSADTLITLFAFLDELGKTSITYQALRSSRIHFALLDICGRATRWPGKLIDRADELLAQWAAMFGPLLDIRPLLYEEGGRLHGISTPEDIERERLLIKWLRAPGIHVSPTVARRHGDLGFKPGDWWINAMFAYHAGIIDNGNPSGGITCDSNEAYALLMAFNDEVSAPTPNMFTYRTKSSDPGRYRLTAATTTTRKPVRVLRSHTLQSFWTPRAGVRYEGLYRVTGWNITYDPRTSTWNYDIAFTRMPSSKQAPMKDALRRPTAEEIDDYKEYKRIRNEVRSARNPFNRARPLPRGPDEGTPRRQSQAYMQQQHQHFQRHPHSHSHSHSSPTKPRRTSELYTETMVGITPPLSPPLQRRSLSTSPVRSEYSEDVDGRATRLDLRSVDMAMGADDEDAGIGRAMASFGLGRGR